MSGNRFNFYSLKQAIRFGIMAFSLLALLAACMNGGGTTPPVADATATGNIGGNPSTHVSVPTPTGPTAAVSMITPGGYTFSFNPATLTISVGTTVIWTNRTTTPHTITSDTDTFNSGLNDPIEAGFTFTYKFTRSGTYKYHCALHPTMTATIIVT